MSEKQEAGKLPSERGRNYTPLWEVVRCALPGASCGKRMIFALLQSSQGTLHFPCAGCRQRRGSVTSPVMIGAEQKSSAFRRKPPAGRNAPP